MKQQLMTLKTTKGERIESIAPVWKDVGFLMDLDPVATGTICMHTNQMVFASAAGECSSCG